MIPMAQHILPVLHAQPLKKRCGPDSFINVLKVWVTVPYVSRLISPCMQVLIVSIGCDSDAADDTAADRTAKFGADLRPSLLLQLVAEDGAHAKITCCENA
eukprot:CAMPEP_0205906586 /NCGR_PEP_ID=MMETSP1325-20131115/2032_1 /ASSEMBLY_ACC=CAM_ASM_000708 /TAXON_ID=236786 /ORGANISM="Florenciella sp., Strain RCC1007" /LENGTH=100 /DNA_ID=CAMNT_0053272611 /DNA_START=142 /DNA_END=440 /DNA_ORIENTATION=+